MRVLPHEGGKTPQMSKERLVIFTVFGCGYGGGNCCRRVWFWWMEDTSPPLFITLSFYFCCFEVGCVVLSVSSELGLGLAKTLTKTKTVCDALSAVTLLSVVASTQRRNIRSCCG